MANIAVGISLAFVFLSCTCRNAGGTRSNLPIKTTMKTAHGDIFDCVDIYKQPSLNHPLLKDHKILTKPAGVPFQGLRMEGPEVKDPSFHVEFNYEGCPSGTVPVHRIPKTNLTDEKPNTIANSNDLNHWWATIEATRRHYYGSSASLNVYNVENVKPGQDSSAVVGIKNKDAPMEIRGEVRAGWKVNPSIFGDTKTRLFVEWSADGSKTSCVNLRCPGFVQTHKTIFPGSTITPVSTKGGPQYYIHLHVYKDADANWWVAFGKDLNNRIGYWPKELFKQFDFGTMPYFGGLVMCYDGELCPAMGNGDYAPRCPGYRQCDAPHDPAKVRMVQVIGPDGKWGGLGGAHSNPYFSLRDCYGVGPYVHASGGEYRFTFGGPPCKLTN